MPLHAPVPPWVPTRHLPAPALTARLLPVVRREPTWAGTAGRRSQGLSFQHEAAVPSSRPRHQPQPRLWEPEGRPWPTARPGDGACRGSMCASAQLPQKGARPPEPRRARPTPQSRAVPVAMGRGQWARSAGHRPSQRRDPEVMRRNPSSVTLLVQHSKMVGLPAPAEPHLSAIRSNSVLLVSCQRAQVCSP